jgi:hypothetical protein
VFDVISSVAAYGDDVPKSAEGGVAHDFFVAGSFVMIAGAIGSLGAAVTGFWDWWKSIERDPSGVIGRAKHTQVWRTINWHMTVMLTVTGLVIVDIVVRLVAFDDGYASLVYDYQFNVESLEGSIAWDETEVDQAPSDHGQSE